MDNDKLLGKNIKNIRESYRETQEELAHILDLGDRQAIYNYETGKRNPHYDILSKIAKHYGVTVDLLLNSEFKKNNLNITSNDFYSNIYKIYPVLSTEKALENKYFNIALKKHKELFDGIKNKNTDGLDLCFSLCIDNYLDAIDDKEALLVSLCNLLGINMLIVLSFKFDDLINDNYAAIEMIKKNDKLLKEEIDDLIYDNVAKENMKEFENYFKSKEYLDFYNSIIKQIKDSYLYYIADYYIALDYYFGFGNKSLSTEQNRVIGHEMLRVFAKYGNKYAKRLLKI